MTPIRPLDRTQTSLTKTSISYLMYALRRQFVKVITLLVHSFSLLQYWRFFANSRYEIGHPVL
jgi:hypothetical protein